jgi:hypothetical protein
MTAEVYGHRLIFGIAASAAARGWSFVARSTSDLSPAIEKQIATMTNVGALSGHEFTGSIGYFGVVLAAGKSWVVLARSYRSPLPERTGQHVVQRDIFLVPERSFVEASADAAAFLEALPKEAAIESDDTPLPPWPVPKVVEDRSRLEALKDSSDDFLVQLLSAAISDSAVLLLRSPQPSIIPALVLLLPPAIRRRVTYCTLVGDATVPLRLKEVRTFPTAITGLLADLEKERFNRDVPVLPIAKALVDSWRAGGTALSEHQTYLERVFADRIPEPERIASAHEQWSKRKRFYADANSTSRWASAADYIQTAGPDAEADRLEAAEQLISTLDLPADAAHFSRFLKGLRPQPVEMTAIIKAVSKRLRAGEIAAVESALGIFSGFSSVEEFTGILFANLDETVKTIDLLLAVQTAAPTSVAEEDRADALAKWPFRKDPSQEQLRGLFTLVKSEKDVQAVRRNATLSKQVGLKNSGVLALRLTELSVSSRLADPKDFHELEQLAIDAAAALDDAFKAIKVAKAGWDRTPRFNLLLTSRLIVASGKRNPPAEVTNLFVATYENASDELIAVLGDLLVQAKKRVGRDDESLRRTLRIADWRRSVANAVAALEEALAPPFDAWKLSLSGHSGVSASDVLSVLKKDSDGLAGSPAAWALLPKIVTDDSRLLADWADIPNAQTFLACVGLAILGQSNLGSREALRIAVEASNAMRSGGRSGIPQIAAQYEATTAEEVETLQALVAIMCPQAAAANVRQGVGGRMATRERTSLALDRLREFSQLLAELDREHVGSVDRIAAAMAEVEPVNAAEIRNVAESILQKLGNDSIWGGRPSFLSRLKDVCKAAKKAATTASDTGLFKSR